LIESSLAKVIPMKIHYTGKHEAFPPRQLAKFEAKLQKLSRMLERRGEREAHVILTQQRFLHKVEITLNAWEHAMVGVGSAPDLVAAANAALDKLEKQLLKLRNKWRDTKRKETDGVPVPEAATVSKAGAGSRKTGRAPVSSAMAGNHGRKKVFRVNHGDGSKPMTLEEAMLEMEAAQDYMVYRDANTDRVTVLMRRPDGHFDLIES
jgi:putative sigma-54 modulation protein